MEFITPLDGCPDATALIEYLQAAAEKTRAGLSRELHNEMGGLLVAAAMDVAFAEQALANDDRLRQPLSRARNALAAAIDLKRKVIERLRPSTLDNFGLFEAIRWEVKQESGRAGLSCSERYPDSEPKFSQDAAIALFRIAQESLGVALRQPSVKAAHLALDIDADTLRLCVSHDGVASSGTLAPNDVLAICAIAHRVHALGGRMTVTGLSGGGAEYVASLPLAPLIAPLAPAAAHPC
jgi:signal transduction histidine kinase